MLLPPICFKLQFVRLLTELRDRGGLGSLGNAIVADLGLIDALMVVGAVGDANWWWLRSCAADWRWLLLAVWLEVVRGCE